MITGIALILAGIALGILGFHPVHAGARHAASIAAGVLGIVVAILGLLVLLGVGSVVA